jgi:hypothetical protein
MLSLPYINKEEKNMFEFYRERKDDLQFRLSLRKTAKEWWYAVEQVFNFSFEIGLFKIMFHIIILDSLHFKMNFVFLHYYLNLPDQLEYWFSWHKAWSISKHKGLEIQMMCNSCLTLSFSIQKSIHIDHAPLFIKIDFFIISFDINIHDDRHWNDEKNRWIEWDYENERWVE